MPPNEVEFQESNSIVFEWRLRGLRNLFEASKGETKSKVTKSAMFGGGKWQVLFYANAGTGHGSEGTSGHISLFLSCEPTEEEKEAALNGKWTREGAFKFSFEVHDLSKTAHFNTKEAPSHAFTWKTANWGWAQFCRRDAVYYNRPSVRSADAFLITCTICGQPESPSPVPNAPRLAVPRDLLDAVGGLLDDPIYSDVEFVLPRRGSSHHGVKHIFAMKNILKRAEYFDFMFNGGFAESSAPYTLPEDGSASEEASEVDFGSHADDSDEEDEYRSDAESEIQLGKHTSTADSTGSSSLSRPASTDASLLVPVDSSGVGGDQTSVAQTTASRLSHPSSPRSSHIPPPTIFRSFTEREGSRGSPQKMRVVVKDVAYSTYRAVLYYLYTDIIHFAPLSSSFNVKTANPQSATLPSSSDKASQITGDVYTSQQPNINSRREFISLWAQANPGRPIPCSAKAVYRLADKLGLRELRERAFEHITKSLTVENVPHEVFSTFSATFEAVRKVEVKFFLDHWADIRSSDAMRSVWQQIRLGRHPGFEEGSLAGHRYKPRIQPA